MGQTERDDRPEAVRRRFLGPFETEVSGARGSAMIDNLMEWADAVLWYKVGAAGVLHMGEHPPC